MYATIGTRTLYTVTKDVREFSLERIKGELKVRLGRLEIWLGRRIRRGAADPFVSFEI